MKKNGVKAAAVSLTAVSLVMLALLVLAATKPGVAYASQAALQARRQPHKQSSRKQQNRLGVLF